MINISDEEKLVFKYLNNPGYYMDSTWWTNLNMTPMKTIFFSSDRLQIKINKIIKQKLGTSKYTIQDCYNDDFFEKKILSKVQDIKTLLIALGLIRLNKIELLTHKNFVSQVQKHLTKEQINQCLNILLTLSPKVNKLYSINMTPISEKHLPSLAYFLGYLSLVKNEPIWDVLKILFPYDFTLFIEKKEIELSQKLCIQLIKLLL